MAVSLMDKRIHWLDAAARWLSLGREQGVLLRNEKSTELPGDTARKPPPNSSPWRRHPADG